MIWCFGKNNGFTENQNLILDIDECESNDNSCDNSKETCENSDGSYICNCVGGYRKLNQQCNGKNWRMVRMLYLAEWKKQISMESIFKLLNESTYFIYSSSCYVHIYYD